MILCFYGSKEIVNGCINYNFFNFWKMNFNGLKGYVVSNC